MKNHICVTIFFKAMLLFVYSFQKHVLAELELNQTKPQLRFSETQEDTKTWCQKVNCHALQSPCLNLKQV